MTATAERPRAALKEFRVLLDPERVNELRVQATVETVTGGKTVNWCELLRAMMAEYKGGDRG